MLMVFLRMPCAIAGATSPALADLTAADLMGWGCSIHEYFDNTFPLPFQVFRRADPI